MPDVGGTEIKMGKLTKQQMKDIIDGKAKAADIPMLYNIWVYPSSFGEKEDYMKEWLAKQPFDIEYAYVSMPEVLSAPESDPDYRWAWKNMDAKERRGIDENGIIEDWEDEEEVKAFYDTFPSADSIAMIPDVQLNQEHYVLAHWLFCFFERHWSLRGMENALTDFYLYPDEVHDLYQKVADFYMRAMERIHEELGADGVFVTDDIGTQTGPFFSVDIFREFFKPYYKQIIDKAHELNMHFWLHTCGNIEAFLEDFIEIGLDVIHPIQKYTMDEKHIADTYGGRICFLAGFDVQQTIPFGTTDEVREEVRHLIDTFYRPEGRFMLTAGNGSTPDWKIESVEALFDETMKYREEKKKAFLEREK